MKVNLKCGGCSAEMMLVRETNNSYHLKCEYCGTKRMESKHNHSNEEYFDEKPISINGNFSGNIVIGNGNIVNDIKTAS